LPRPKLAAAARTRATARRLRLWIVLAVVVGAATGLGVAAIHVVIETVSWGPLSHRSDWWIALLPIAALVGSTMLVGLTHERSTETTEDYIRVFHDPKARIRASTVPARLLAAVSTIALGGSMGLEGPSIFLGAAIGDIAERRLQPVIDHEEAKVILVAGAAAGIAAIFKAPVTGIVFALEVPYRDDLARRALIPAMFAAATSYVVFAALAGTTPLFPVAAAPLRFGDLGGALLIGLVCGIGARLFVRMHRETVRAARRLPYRARPLVLGGVVAATGAVALAVYHLPLPLGPGYTAILRAARGQGTWQLLLLLLALKMVATSATAAGNGVGGLFFPVVMMGATLGGAVGHALPGPPSLFAVVGIAAFLGGAYKVPLAGVAFVAETTGAPGYIIPGLLAAAVGYLASGGRSISHRQRFRRRIDLETRLDVPVGDVMYTNVRAVPPDATVRELVSEYAIVARARTVAVVAADGAYLGAVRLDALRSLPADRWDATRVRDMMDEAYPIVEPSTPLWRCVQEMRRFAVDWLPVVAHGRLVGTITTAEVIRLEQIVDLVDEQERHGLEP